MKHKIRLVVFALSFLILTMYLLEKLGVTSPGILWIGRAVVYDENNLKSLIEYRSVSIIGNQIAAANLIYLIDSLNTIFPSLGKYKVFNNNRRKLDVLAVAMFSFFYIISFLDAFPDYLFTLFLFFPLFIVQLVLAVVKHK